MKPEGAGKNSAGLRTSLDILRLISERPEAVPFNELKESLSLAAPTLSRLLKVLMDEGWVYKEENGSGYAVGDLFRHISHRVAGTVSREEAMTPIVKWLARKTGESAGYVEWAGAGFQFMAKQEMPDSYHYIPTLQINGDVFHNGFGVTCLAWQEPGVQARVLGRQELPQASEIIYGRLAVVRNERFLKSIDKGIRFIAPVLNRKTEAFIGAMGVSTIPRDIDEKAEKNLAESVLKAASRASIILS
ncbi:MAG: helix-turn-helix domain-containing protein [Planctomycetes bacterium]|nr:helix-turn-helix domain-containing protein [Planctomycetota bacterium]